MSISGYMLYGISAFFILLIGSALFAPIRCLVKTAIRLVWGLLGVVLCSVGSSFLGIAVGINAVNTVIVTILGPAGMLLLPLLSWSFT